MLVASTSLIERRSRGDESVKIIKEINLKVLPSAKAGVQYICADSYVIC